MKVMMKTERLLRTKKTVGDVDKIIIKWLGMTQPDIRLRTKSNKNVVEGNIIRFSNVLVSSRELPTNVIEFSIDQIVEQ